MGDDDDKKDYDVGYGKPPKHTRFGEVLGNLRNTKGRPKGRNVVEFDRLSEEALWDSFLQAALSPVSMGKGENEKTVPFVMALAKRMAQDAIKGDHHACKEFLRMLEKATKGTDKMKLDLYSALADCEERRINALGNVGSLEFFDAKYALYMSRKHLRNIIDSPDLMYMLGEPIIDEDWTAFMTLYERLKADPKLILPWPPKYPSDDMK